MSTWKRRLVVAASTTALAAGGVLVPVSAASARADQQSPTAVTGGYGPEGDCDYGCDDYGWGYRHRPQCYDRVAWVRKVTWRHGCAYVYWTKRVYRTCDGW